MSIIGNKAPSFSAQAAFEGEAKTISLDDYKGKWLVLFFYPLDFTFVCPTEIVAFDDAYESFKAVGAEVLGCSVDSHHTHLAWMRTPRSEAGVGELKYPLLSDLGGRIASAYDVLYGDVALRGVFIIDPDGVVQAATINFDPIGRNVGEVLRTLKAAQYTRKSGNVCPANWQEGEEGMEKSLAGVAKTISH
jgi:peroxiredoxin (alkyl hydroperoxide reductase subunit C)